MKLRTILFISVALIASVISINAQVPAQTAPLKIGVINSQMFTSETGGITRLVAALRTLDNEFKPRREEITTLVTRFDALQKPAPPNTTPAQLAQRQEQAQTLQIDIRRKQEDARVAYAKRMSVLTDPIRASIFTALETYMKARGVDLLVDIAKFPDGVLLVNRNADMTPAFIKDFNTKNP